MFTGIVSATGRVRALRDQGDRLLEIATTGETTTIAHGASICCSGVCLTAIDKGPDWFAVSVSGETLARTTIGRWAVGARVNLERALRIGDELGGHLVSGHVDGLVRVLRRTPDGDSTRFVFASPAPLARFIAPKGSVAIDGVSLTVNEVEGTAFGVNIIPHTRDATTLGDLRVGDEANLEIDMLARYVARLLQKD